MRSFFFSQLAFSFFYMFLLFPSPRLFYNDRSQILWGGESIFLFVKKNNFHFSSFHFFLSLFCSFSFRSRAVSPPLLLPSLFRPLSLSHGEKARFEGHGSLLLLSRAAARERRCRRRKL
jgi:hypothetical protein